MATTTVPILVIGAGPHALATLLSLAGDDEQLLADSQRKLTHWILRTTGKNAFGSKSDLAANVAVVDPSGRFNSRWRSYFSALEIEHLRSPMTVHPDPTDDDSLLAFAFSQGRLERDTVDMGAALERGSARRRGRKEVDVNVLHLDRFRLPRTSLFNDFCQVRTPACHSPCLPRSRPDDVPSTQSLVDGMDLDSLVRRDKVERVEMVSSDPPQYRASLASGGAILCSAVIMATGPTATPRLPARCLPSPPLAEARPAALPLGECLQRWPVLHTNDLFAMADALIAGRRRPVRLTSGLQALAGPEECAEPAAPPQSASRRRRRKRREATASAPRQAASPQPERSSHPAGEAAVHALLTDMYAGRHVVVVGGGLSSGHLCLSAVAHGAKSVRLLVRSEHGLRMRQFDIPFSWTGRWRNAERLEFFSQPREQRLKSLQTVRAGGSVTPEVWQRLVSAQQSGKLSIRAGVTVDSIARGGADPVRVALSDGTAVTADLVVLATGCNNASMVAPGTLLGELLASTAHANSPETGEEEEETSFGGLPLLNESLELPRCPGVHVLGAGAALTLGPDALNLMGARAGADRVREPLLRLLDGEEGEEDTVAGAAYTYANGNCFALLTSM